MNICDNENNKYNENNTFAISSVAPDESSHSSSPADKVKKKLPVLCLEGHTMVETTLKQRLLWDLKKKDGRKYQENDEGGEYDDDDIFFSCTKTVTCNTCQSLFLNYTRKQKQQQEERSPVVFYTCRECDFDICFDCQRLYPSMTQKQKAIAAAAAAARMPSHKQHQQEEKRSSSILNSSGGTMDNDSTTAREVGFLLAMDSSYWEDPYLEPASDIATATATSTSTHVAARSNASCIRNRDGVRKANAVTPFQPTVRREEEEHPQQHKLSSSAEVGHITKKNKKVHNGEDNADHEAHELRDYPSPTAFGWTHVGGCEVSNVAFFEKRDAHPERKQGGIGGVSSCDGPQPPFVELHIYYSIGMVKTILNYPISTAPTGAGRARLVMHFLHQGSSLTIATYKKILLDPMNYFVYGNGICQHSRRNISQGNVATIGYHKNAINATTPQQNAVANAYAVADGNPVVAVSRTASSDYESSRKKRMIVKDKEVDEEKLEEERRQSHFLPTEDVHEFSKDIYEL